MTTTLHKAFEKASRLSPRDQDLLALQIIDDIKNEINWKSSLKKPSSKIIALANKSLKEFKAGKTTKMGFDEL